MPLRHSTEGRPPNIRDARADRLLQSPKLLLRISTESITMANCEMLQLSESRLKDGHGAFVWETILAAQSGETFWGQWSYALAHPFFKKVRERRHVDSEDIEDIYRVRQALTLIFGPLYFHHANRMPVLSKEKLVESMQAMKRSGRESYEREVFAFMLDVNHDWCIHFGAVVNSFFQNKDSYHRYLIFLMAKTLFERIGNSPLFVSAPYRSARHGPRRRAGADRRRPAPCRTVRSTDLRSGTAAVRNRPNAHHPDIALGSGAGR
jgi:hypothetical protein